MTDNRLTEIERCNGMEMNVEKSKVMRISRQPSPLRITIDQKQLENVEYFNYLGSMMPRCTLETESRISMAKAAFDKENTLFTSKSDLNLRKKLLSATFGAQLCMVLKRGHFGK